MLVTGHKHVVSCLKPRLHPGFNCHECFAPRLCILFACQSCGGSTSFYSLLTQHLTYCVCQIFNKPPVYKVTGAFSLIQWPVISATNYWLTSTGLVWPREDLVVQRGGILTEEIETFNVSELWLKLSTPHGSFQYTVMTDQTCHHVPWETQHTFRLECVQLCESSIWKYPSALGRQLCQMTAILVSKWPRLSIAWL